MSTCPNQTASWPDEKHRKFKSAHTPPLLLQLSALCHNFRGIAPHLKFCLHNPRRVGTDMAFLTLSAGISWTLTGSNSGRNMWDSTVGINTRWEIKMSTQDPLITLVSSEVNMNT